MARFYVTVQSMWSNDGKFKVFSDKQLEHTCPPYVQIRRKCVNCNSHSCFMSCY